MAHRIRFACLTLLCIVAVAPGASWAASPRSGVPAALLSSQAATRAAAVSPPTIDAPGSVNASTDQSISILATATDPDAGDELTISAAGYPASLTLSHVPSVSPSTATLSGTLGAGDAGTYVIEWGVSDGSGGTATATTSLTVIANRDPVLSAPSSVSGSETIHFEFSANVSDADGDPINAFTASGLPAGASFTVNALRTVGIFAWTPASGQAGTYVINFSASSGSPARSATASTTVTVGPPDRPPVITSPATVNAIATYPTSFIVTVSDPDGDAITKLEVEGTQNTALPAGATVTINATNTSATFNWTPTATQVGNFGIDEVAQSGPAQLQVVKVTRVVVRDDRAPVVTAPATVSGTENTSISFTVSAADPDGHAINSLTALGLPLGATFSANAANTSGTCTWTPGFNQAGSYTVMFRASNALTGSANTTINVADQNRPPVANAGGPYSGVAGIAVAFDGSASSDPDGLGLSYSWDFGDGMSGSGAMPSHVYAAGGAFAVSLTVTDGGTAPLSDTATTTATIASSFEARVHTTGGNKSIKLNSGKPRWCVQVEPVAGDFAIAEVDLQTLVLEYGGSQIPAENGKTSATGDLDGNGISEITACFSKANLRTLFAGLPSGRSSVTATVEASLASGARITGSITLEVVASGGALAASVTPNPLNPEAVLSFATMKSGPLHVLLYDVSGRKVRTLADDGAAGAGYHDVRIDGRGDRGEQLASGTYFFRIVSADGVAAGRITIMK
jgi:hypothetical protein